MSETIRYIYLVRHGVTAWNRALRLQGHSDIPLDAEGEAQAQLLAQRLASCAKPPLKIFSSDLQRAKHTAEIIAAPLGVTVEINPQLRETCLGEWEGLTREEIVARGEGERWIRYQEDGYRNRPPGAESIEGAWARMVHAMNHIRETTDAPVIAVVGHGGSLRSLLCEALGMPMEHLQRLWLSNASLSIIEERKREGFPLRRRVALLNDTSHIPNASPFQPS